MRKGSEPNGKAEMLQPGASTSHVAVIDASGSHEELEAFFQGFDADSGIAFVVLGLALNGGHVPFLTELPLLRVAEGAPVELRPNHVYLAPRADLALREQQLSLVPAGTGTLLRDVAREFADRGAALLLSKPHDELGLVELHQAGGLVLTSNPLEGPLASLLEAPVPAAAMPAAVLAFANLGPVKSPSDAPEALAAASTSIFSRLRKAFGVDFSQYKPATIERRFARRVATHYDHSLVRYAERVEQDDVELERLFKDLLIGMTRFFRDAELFDLLAERIVPALVDRLPEGEDVRVWVPACATGEEAYSLGMLLLEAFEERGRAPSVRILATDVHRGALQIASEGVYSEEALDALPRGFRGRYFTREVDGRYRVSERLRKLVLFSPHNLLRDTPFNRIDLVTCRNLLIYLQSTAQARAISMLHFALKREGTMVLGPSEGIGEAESAFSIVDRSWKVFRKNGDVRLPWDVSSSAPAQSPGRTRAPDYHLRRVHEDLLRRFVPTGVLVNGKREAVHIFGDAHRYLQMTPGVVTQDITRLCHGELRLAVASGITHAQKQNERVILRSVPLEEGGVVDVAVEPFVDGATGSTYSLVLFEAERAAPPSRQVDLSASRNEQERIEQLERDLQYSRESLQSVVEALETANEELQASNEELLASNGELQTTNEELHSVNEELYTVNVEHEQRIRDQNETMADLRNLLDATQVGTVFTDAELRVRLFNPSAEQVLNLLPQDLGRPLSHLTSKVQDDDTVAEAEKVMVDGEPRQRQLRLRDGGTVLRNVRPYLLADGKVSGVILTFVDISEVVSAQENAREQQERLAALNDAVPNLLFSMNREGTVTHTNAQFSAYTGVAHVTSLAPDDRSQLMHPDDLPRVRQSWVEASQSGGTFRTQVRLRRHDGEWRWFDFAAVPVGTAGTVAQWYGAATDIHDIKNASADLRLLLDTVPAAIAFWDKNLRNRFGNRMFGEWLGVDAEALRGHPIGEVMTPAVYLENVPRFERVLAGEQQTFERVLPTADGSFRHISASYVPMLQDGEVSGFLAIGMDVTATRQATEQLEESESRFRRMANDISVLVWLSRPDGEREFFNARWLETVGGSEEEEGALWPTRIHLEDRAPFMQVYSRAHAERTGFGVEYRLQTRTGSYLWVLSRATPRFDAQGTFLGLTGCCLDISDQKAVYDEQARVERKIQEAARLESVGVLAGGIAHDFNNILTSVMANASLAMEEAHTPSLRESLEDITTSAERAADLCRQMLAYAGKGSFEFRTVDVAQIIRDTSRLIQASVPKNVTLHMTFAPHCRAIQADPTQLRQVVMNLIINGAEAIGAKAGSVKVNVEATEITEPPETAVFVSPTFRAGAFVELTVADTGCGIADDLVRRVFEPFYSTKFTGRGLGLSAVQGIIGSHGGVLDLTSSAEGTTFRAYFPATALDTVRVDSRRPPPALPPTEGKGTILVVDDEDAIRSVVVRALSRVGFACVTAAEGREAVQLFQAAPARFRLVVVDLTMPVMDGKATMRAMREAHADVRFVVMSGLASADALAQCGDEVVERFVEKPFDAQSMVDAVFAALDGGSPSAVAQAKEMP